MQIDNQTPFAIQPLPTYGPQDKPVLAVIVKATFDMHDEQCRPSEEQLPIEFGDHLFDPAAGGSVKFESDLAPFKPRADVVLVGRAHAPGNVACDSFDVSLRVGGLYKQLRVFGRRHWTCMGKMLPVVMSDPLPFTTQDLVYEHAFGGIDLQGGGYCAENPVGCGFFNKKTRQGIDGAPLPCIEDSKHVIRSWKDHPCPAGFGFIGKSWAPRAAMLGTYDDVWRTERAPRPPADFNFEFHNGAHPDLRANGYLGGDELVEMINLTPDGYRRFQLPGLRLTCTVGKTDALLKIGPAALPDDSAASPASAESAAHYLEDIDMNPDTLCIIADENRFYLVWRGLCELVDPTAMEIGTIKISIA